MSECVFVEKKFLGTIKTLLLRHTSYFYLTNLKSLISDLTKNSLYILAIFQIVFSNVRARHKKMAQIVVTNGENEKIFSTCIVLPEQESEFLSCNLSGIKRLTRGQFLYLDISPPTLSHDINSLRPTTNFGGFWIGD